MSSKHQNEHFLAATPEELKAGLLAAVQHRIARYKSQSAAARAWGVAQSTVNEIANGKERCSSQYLIELLLLDGCTLQVVVHD